MSSVQPSWEHPRLGLPVGLCHPSPGPRYFWHALRQPITVQGGRGHIGWGKRVSWAGSCTTAMGQWGPWGPPHLCCIPQGAAMKAQESPKHIFPFPESSIDTNLPSRGRHQQQEPSLTPLPVFPAILGKSLGLIPCADKYPRSVLNWEQLAFVSGYSGSSRADRSIHIRARPEGAP